MLNLKELTTLARLAAYGLGGGSLLLFTGSIFKSNGFGSLGELMLFVTVAGICLLKK